MLSLSAWPGRLWYIEPLPGGNDVLPFLRVLFVVEHFSKRVATCWATNMTSRRGCSVARCGSLSRWQGTGPCGLAGLRFGTTLPPPPPPPSPPTRGSGDMAWCRARRHAQGSSRSSKRTPSLSPRPWSRTGWIFGRARVSDGGVKSRRLLDRAQESDGSSGST